MQGYREWLAEDKHHMFSDDPSFYFSKFRTFKVRRAALIPAEKLSKRPEFGAYSHNRRTNTSTSWSDNLFVTTPYLTFKVLIRNRVLVAYKEMMN